MSLKKSTWTSIETWPFFYIQIIQVFLTDWSLADADCVTLHFFTKKKLISMSIFCQRTRWCPSSLAKLVNITPITMIYGTQITIVNGVYKPTNITGGHHPEPQKLHKAAQFDKFRACSKATWAASACRREKLCGTAGFCGICPEKAQKEQRIRSPVDLQ